MLVVVALLVLNFGTLGYLFLGKGHPNGGMPPHHPKPDKLIIERLQLTPEQITEFEILKNEHNGGIVKLNERSKGLYEEYFALLKTENPDEVAADSLERQLAQIQSQKDHLTFDHFLKLRKLCTDEQKPLFDDFLDELGNILVKQPPRPRH